MLITFDMVKTLAKIVYELRAEAQVLVGIHELLLEAKLMRSVLLRQAGSIELMLTSVIGAMPSSPMGATEFAATHALTQGERDQIWMLLKEGRSRLV